MANLLFSAIFKQAESTQVWSRQKQKHVCGSRCAPVFPKSVPVGWASPGPFGYIAGNTAPGCIIAILLCSPFLRKPKFVPGRKPNIFALKCETGFISGSSLLSLSVGAQRCLFRAIGLAQCSNPLWREPTHSRATAPRAPPQHGAQPARRPCTARHDDAGDVVECLHWTVPGLRGIRRVTVRSDGAGAQNTDG